ncbi:hypothetical protein AVEN_48322-1 [Araneus ventricosus]|uniref:Uncharacterized protein n=1 Tax=Araneus ventricosus TaxID=182803 RepID=A0A4Y2DB11_ARAVE|nr:hypothetical protein AVEN_48322-1 [Araneus ventricosus]
MCSECIPFVSSTCSKCVIARATVVQRVSRSISVIWRAMLSFNSGSPHAPSIDAMFQESPQLEATGIQVRRTSVPGSLETSQNCPIISKVVTKQMPALVGQFEWRTILHEDKSLNTLFRLRQE